MSLDPRSISWRLRLCGVTLVLVLGAGAANAVDGVIEINDARVVVGGVTPGDAPGYPLTIDQPGSYRLTGQLFVSDPTLNVVEITADHVTLDLNGFAIRCVVVFTPCVGNGFGSGILAYLASDVTVRNGVIRDFGGSGLSVGAGARIEDLRVLDNGTDGITIGYDGLVAGSVIRGNGANGIDLSGDGVVITDNVIANNAGYGIDNDTDMPTYRFAYAHNSLRSNGLGPVSSFSNLGIQLAVQTAGNFCSNAASGLCP